MRVRTPEAAVDDLLHRLRAPVSCVTERSLLATGRRVASRPQFVSFAPINEPVSLRLQSGAAITFSFRYDYEILPTGDVLRRFETRVVGYRYEIADTDGRELITFHWHPVGVSPITFPHLHLSSRIGAVAIGGGESVSLGEMHIPTGPVEMDDVVRLLIAEFGVRPRRPDWNLLIGPA